jgi:hypothetical protein
MCRLLTLPFQFCGFANGLSEQHSGKLGGARCYVMTQLKHTMCVVIGGVVRAHSTPCHSFMGYVALARSYSVQTKRVEAGGRSARLRRANIPGLHKNENPSWAHKYNTSSFRTGV